MRRATLLFAAGLLLGALAMYLARSDDSAVPTATATLPSDAGPEQPGRTPSTPRAIDFLELVAGSIDVTEHAALYRLAAEADRAMLASLVGQVAALPKLPSRALALEVLLTRYAELDAPAAAALARELELEAAVIAPLFAAWARRDSGAALDALGDLDSATATTLGIALLQTIGNDDLGIIRVLGAAPQIDPDRFRLEAAVAKAATDPEDATADALLLPASKSAAALGRIAAIWARSDVHGAVAYFDYIDDERLRNEFKVAVLREWAGLDPEGLLTYVRGLAAAEQDDAVPGALQALAMIEPARALEAAAQMTGEIGSMVRRVALMTLARDDPLGALRHAEALPVGAERDQMMSAIANALRSARSRGRRRVGAKRRVAGRPCQRLVRSRRRRSRSCDRARLHADPRRGTGATVAIDRHEQRHARRAHGRARGPLGRAAEPDAGIANADGHVGATRARGRAALVARESGSRHAERDRAGWNESRA